MITRIVAVMLWSLAVVSLTACADMAPVLPLPPDPTAALKLPPGFVANVFARLSPAGGDYFRGPRFMAFGPDGNLYLSLGLDHKVVMLPDANHDGRADAVVTVADQLNGPQGLAFADGRLYVANQDGVVRLEQKNGQWPAAGVTPIIADLPAGGHTLKTLRLGPDGYFYLNVGSSCNVCMEADPLRATILRYSVDGRPAGALTTLGRHAPSPIWAAGLRNSEGFAWHPQTGAMYATNNGADMRSDSKGGAPVDDLPPEHLNRIEAGRHYGWPHCWGDHVTDPNFPGAEGLCARAQPPALTFSAHAAPLGITFLDKSAFPSDYREDALVALHGSWNRRQPSGYKVVRVHFDHGQPVSSSDFITGWLTPGGAWGRPVDVTSGPDGALYVSDDRAGLVYRIIYSAQQENGAEK
jgi:glucose/arabinose dehydrogenase